MSKILERINKLASEVSAASGYISNYNPQLAPVLGMIASNLYALEGDIRQDNLMSRIDGSSIVCTLIEKQCGKRFEMPEYFRRMITSHAVYVSGPIDIRNLLNFAWIVEPQKIAPLSKSRFVKIELPGVEATTLHYRTSEDNKKHDFTFSWDDNLMNVNVIDLQLNKVVIKGGEYLKDDIVTAFSSDLMNVISNAMANYLVGDDWNKYTDKYLTRYITEIYNSDDEDNNELKELILKIFELCRMIKEVRYLSSVGVDVNLDDTDIGFNIDADYFSGEIKLKSRQITDKNPLAIKYIIDFLPSILLVIKSKLENMLHKEDM